MVTCKSIMLKTCIKTIFLLLLVTVLNNAHAQLRLPGILSSNMVLQQKDSVQLWGWADPLEKIIVTTSWNNHTDSVVTSNAAKWSLKVKTPAAGGPYTISFKGYTSIELNNIMIGEVWVCSGQSNMEWSYYAGVYDMQPEVNLNTQSNIRFLKIPKAAADNPQENVSATWTVCDSNTIKAVSAVGYFFAKKLQHQLNVPIGIISTAWGATPAEVWTPKEIINKNQSLKQAAATQSERPWCPREPGSVYNTMIAPITSFPIAGAIWYQGESNSGASSTYASLLTTMVDSWRAAWKKDFPFYLVQIAPFTYGKGYGAALLREAQQKAATHHRMGMAVIYDLVDDTTNIHPKNKKDVGARLGNIALAETYQQSGIEYKYPEYENMQVTKNKITLSFKNTDALVLKGKTASAILIAGEDKIFYPAEARIEGGKLIVWNKQVKQPVAVRYVFSNAGIGNLFGNNGLPVAPFRTDEWPVE